MAHEEEEEDSRHAHPQQDHHLLDQHQHVLHDSLHPQPSPPQDHNISTSPVLASQGHMQMVDAHQHPDQNAFTQSPADQGLSHLSKGAGEGGHHDHVMTTQPPHMAGQDQQGIPTGVPLANVTDMTHMPHMSAPMAGVGYPHSTTHLPPLSMHPNAVVNQGMAGVSGMPSIHMQPMQHMPPPHGMVQDMHGVHSMAPMGMHPEIPGVIPDYELKPAQLCMADLQRELTARGIVYTEHDKVTNIGRLIAYLIDQKQAGDSDLSSESSDESDDDSADKEDHTFAFLEVLLVSYGQQKKPLLDWLYNWQKTAEEFNRVEITELEESSLIKIRIWNNTSEPSGLVEQLNGVNIKCARYYCYTRGLVWGGWEFYENGQLQKQEGYNGDNQPPLFWKRLCWVENADVDLTIFDKYNSVLAFPSKQISRMFGTGEEMICSSCGNTEDICAKVHGSFKGYFESKDLFDRHMAVVMQ